MSRFADLLGERIVATLFVTFLHVLWQGAVVAGVAAIGLWLLPRRRPEARYAWSAASLAVLVALPVITAARVSRPTSPDATGGPGALPAASIDGISTPPRHADGFVAPTSPEPPVTSAEPGSRARRPFLAERAAPWVVTAWLVGALALLARSLGGWLLLRRRVLRRGSPVGGPWPEILRRTATRLGIRRRVRLVGSDDAPVPLVAGWLRPVVVMPTSLLTGVPTGTIEALLAHELAHVRRHDYLVNLLQIAAESALFFHPAVWWLSARIREEREHCCDEVAAAMVGERLGYARALLEVAGELSGRRLVAASGGSLLRRIRRLTGADPRSPLPSPWAGASLLLAIPLALAVAAWTPNVGGSPAPAERAAPRTLVEAAEPGSATEPPGAPDEAGPAVEPAPGSLADRWDRALREIGSAGGWIAWGVSAPADGSTIVSGTPGGPSALRDAPSVRDRLAGAARGTGAVLLLGFDPGAPAGDAVRHVRLRGPDVPVDLGGRSLQWLGNATDAESVALLERLLAASPDPAARAEMAAALSLHADGDLVVRSVARLMDREPEPEVRTEAIRWLDRHSGRAVFDLMRTALANDPDPEVRRAVTTTIDEPAVRDTFDLEAVLLAAIYRDGDPDVREAALGSLEDLPTEAAAAALRRVATDHPDARLREGAVLSLEDRPKDGDAWLLGRLAFEDPAREVREAALDALTDLRSPSATSTLRRIAREHPDPEMRGEARAELEDRRAR